jgi:hypothetical protein
MFFGAFSLRSWETRQTGHPHRFAELSAVFIVPNSKPRGLLGWRRSISLTCRAAQAGVSRIWRRSSPGGDIPHRSATSSVVYAMCQSLHVQIFQDEDAGLSDQRC